MVAAFRGVHVSPAKHSYALLPRKCDYRTDSRMDRQMCCYASQATQKGNSVGGLVKLLAWSKGSGVPNWGLATWVSNIGYLLLPSWDMTEILLKWCKNSQQPNSPKGNKFNYISLHSLALLRECLGFLVTCSFLVCQNIMFGELLS